MIHGLGLMALGSKYSRKSCADFGNFGASGMGMEVRIHSKISGSANPASPKLSQRYRAVAFR